MFVRLLFVFDCLIDYYWFIPRKKLDELEKCGTASSRHSKRKTQFTPPTRQDRPVASASAL